MSGPPPTKRAKQAESETIQLFRSHLYDKIPDIAFYGTSKDKIKPYIKDKMQEQETYSPSYYEFKLNKDDYKLLDLSSDEGQVLLKELFTENENVMNKAFLLEKDKYIRTSNEKEADVAAFKLIRDKLDKLDKEYVGTITNKSSGLSHSEVVIFNQELIRQLNENPELKTDIVVTPKVIRKSQKGPHLRNMPNPRGLFNNSSEADIEGEGMSHRLTRKLTFDGGKRRSVKKSKNQKKTKRNNSTKKRRRTKKKKPSKN